MQSKLLTNLYHDKQTASPCQYPLVFFLAALYSHYMPTENTAHKLAELVKTTDNKILLTNQTRNLINDFSKVAPLSSRDIQNSYPLLYRLLIECYPKANNKFEQKDLEQLLSQIDSLKEVTFNIPSVVPTDALYKKLHKWVTENVGDALIVKFVPVDDITGGILVSYEGRFTNLSLDKILKEKINA